VAGAGVDAGTGAGIVRGAQGCAILDPGVAMSSTRSSVPSSIVQTSKERRVLGRMDEWGGKFEIVLKLHVHPKGVQVWVKLLGMLLGCRLVAGVGQVLSCHHHKTHVHAHFAFPWLPGRMYCVVRDVGCYMFTVPGVVQVHMSRQM